MKWNFNLNLSEPAMLLYYFANVNGLAPFTVKKDGFYPPTLLAKLYLLTLATIYFVICVLTLPLKSKFQSDMHLPKLAEIGIMLEYITTSTATLFIFITFLSMHINISHVLNQLYLITNQLKSLGIEDNCRKYFGNLFFGTAVTNAFMIAVHVAIFVTGNHTHWPILFLIRSHYSIWVQFNSTLIFVGILFFIKKKFALVNERLSTIFRPDNRLQVNFQNLTDRQRFRKIELLHLKLSKIVDHVTGLFAILNLLNSLSLCTKLILKFYTIWKFMKEASSSCFTDVSCLFVISSSLLKMFVVIAESFVVIYASVKLREEWAGFWPTVIEFDGNMNSCFLSLWKMFTEVMGQDNNSYEEYGHHNSAEKAHATTTLLFNVWHEFKPRELEMEFSMFSLQMKHTAIVPSIFGFLDLDYVYPYKIFCAVVSYLVIMIQFDNS